MLQIQIMHLQWQNHNFDELQINQLRWRYNNVNFTSHIFFFSFSTTYLIVNIVIGSWSNQMHKKS